MLGKAGVVDCARASVLETIKASVSPAAASGTRTRTFLVIAEAPSKRKGCGAHHKTGQKLLRAALRFARVGQWHNVPAAVEGKAVSGERPRAWTLADRAAPGGAKLILRQFCIQARQYFRV
jgi:hypothetical protein